MASIINIVLRGLQFLWTLLIVALVGNMIATSFSGDPAIVNYSLFVSVFSMLALLYLVAATVREAFAIPIAMLALDLLNTIFFFCAAVALAAGLDVHSCGNEDYVRSNGITNGSRNMGKRCREAQAVCAFLWFGFAAYLASAVFSGLALRGGKSVPRPSIVRVRGPGMSQV